MLDSVLVPDAAALPAVPTPEGDVPVSVWAEVLGVVVVVLLWLLLDRSWMEAEPVEPVWPELLSLAVVLADGVVLDEVLPVDWSAALVVSVVEREPIPVSVSLRL
jgi:hypothetical protein